jgi:integrase
MATKSLTKDRVESLAYDSNGPSRQILWDSKLRGFGVRVTPEGGKQYVLLYRVSGRQRLMSLGRVQDFKGLQAARDKAEDLLHGLRHEGTDPMAARERMAEARSMSDLWTVYEKEHIAAKSENTRKAVASAWRNHIAPVVGALKPGQVTKADAIRLHDQATAKGGKIVANRAVQRLRAMLVWLFERSERQFPSGWRNPAAGLKVHREKPRTEILDLVQQRSLVAALADEPDPFIRAYLQLLLLTGCRSSELVSVSWKDVDFERATLHVRGNYERKTGKMRERKNGQDLLLPLPPAALKLLRSLPVVENNPYVFPSPRTSAPLTTNAIRIRYNAALKRAGIPHRTLHDLRRSVGTNHARAGASTKLIAGLLGNTAEVTARVYVQLASDDLRRLSDMNAANLLPSAGS